MQIQKETLMRFWTEHFKFSPGEINAFQEIKREHFISERMRSLAYEDRPLPLLRGKTISQPTTVMLMTHSLELNPGEKVFEVGTGSGYQAAILGKIVGSKGRVISAEVIPELVQFARENLKKAGVENAHVFEEDGSKGFPAEAPFDKIIITAACREFPKELLSQLKPEGIIIGPVGNAAEQEMVKGIKRKDGTLALEFLGQFLFTPMYGKYGFEV